MAEEIKEQNPKGSNRKTKEQRKKWMKQTEGQNDTKSCWGWGTKIT